MNRPALALSLHAAVAIASLPARADDPKKDSVTVLPWTDASVVFGSKDKRAAIQYTQALPRSFSLYVKASAPLDEDTRIAAFASENNLAKGFAGELQLGYDSRAARLGELQQQVGRLADAVKSLRSISPVAVMGAQAAFARSHGIPGDDTSLYQYFCRQVEADPNACLEPEVIPAKLAKICAEKLKVPQSEATAELNRKIDGHCSKAAANAASYSSQREIERKALRKVELARSELAKEEVAVRNGTGAAAQVSAAQQKLKEEEAAARAATVKAEQDKADAFQPVANAAAAVVKERCGKAAALSDDQCFLANWSVGFFVRQGAYAVAASFVSTQQHQAERIWDTFKNIDPEKAGEILIKYGSAPEVLVEYPDVLDAVAKAIEGVMGEKVLQRRDILLTGVASPKKGLDHAIALDASISYDRLEVFESDVSTESHDEAQYQAGIGLNYTAYLPVQGLSVNVRGGYERKKDAKAKKLERCVALPSADGTITGKQCDGSALFRRVAVPEPEDTFFARMAIDYQYIGVADAEVLPGVELRGGVEGLKGTRSADFRLTLFATPVKGNTAARVGVALDLNYAIDREGKTDTSSRWTVTPLVFIGATLADLM